MKWCMLTIRLILYVGVCGILKAFESPSLSVKTFERKSWCRCWLCDTNVFWQCKYFEFVAKAREMELYLLFLVLSHWRYKDICKFYRKFSDWFTEDLIDAVDKCKTNDDETSGYRMGYSAILELSCWVPVLHYYSMGKSENIRQIASQLFFCKLFF
jgi:methylenetetrahydrofolate reductase (NADPH)